MRATAIVGTHPHTHYAAQSGRYQGRADSLQPEGQALSARRDLSSVSTRGLAE